MSSQIKKANFTEDFSFIVKNIITFYEENPKELFLSSKERVKTGVKQLFKDKNNFYYIIFLENKKIGFVQMLRTHNDITEIIIIYLQKKYRDKKIGRKALTEIIEEMKNLGIKMFKTEINTHNDRSKHFFKKQHFKKHSSIYLLK